MSLEESVLKAAKECLDKLKFYRRLHSKQCEYIKDLECRIEEYQKVVEPIVAEIDRYDPPENDDHQTLWGNIHITLGDLRKIRALWDRPVGRNTI